MKSLLAAFLLLVFSFSNAQQRELFFSDDHRLVSQAEGYYYVKFEATNSLQDTVYLYYSSDDRLKGREIYKSGVLNGPFVYYHENGRLAAKGLYANGFPIGYVMTWHANGKPNQTLYFPENSDIVGPNQAFDRLIINFADTLGNQWVVNGEGFCRCAHIALVPIEKFLLRGTTTEALLVDARRSVPQFTFRATSTSVEVTGKVVNGLRDSTWVINYSGKNRYKENYDQGVFVDGWSYHNGDSIYYEVLEEPARYDGGMNAFYQTISRNMKYPADARKRGSQGNVFVSFTVGEDGLIRDIEVVKGADPSLNEEAMRVIRLTKPWKPAIQRGRPTSFRMVMPITFKLG